jgi:hypothetical protein
MFRHPSGRAIDEPKSSRLCAYGAECRAPSCEFRHPGGRNVGALPPCRYGPDCKRPGCSFGHPTKESAGSPLQAHSSEAGKESEGENRSSGERALQEQKGRTLMQLCMWGRACYKAVCKLKGLKALLLVGPAAGLPSRLVTGFLEQRAGSWTGSYRPSTRKRST